MKMTKFYAPLAALLLTGAAFTSCSSDDAKSEVVPASKNWSLSIEASSPTLDTRALTYSGENSAVQSKWALGETMEVYNITQGSSYRGLLTPKTGGVIQDFLVTTPEGLTGSFAMNDELKIYYPKKDVTYLGQDGLFSTISEKYDYSTVSVVITDIDEDNRALKATSSKGEYAATFNNDQALVRFTFTCDGAPVAVSYVGVQGYDLGNNKAIVQSMDPITNTKVLDNIDIQVPAGQESDVIWAALRCNANVKLTLDVIDAAGAQYSATTTSYVQFENGHYYDIPVPLKQVEAAPTGGGSMVGPGAKARN